MWGNKVKCLIYLARKYLFFLVQSSIYILENAIAEIRISANRGVLFVPCVNTCPWPTRSEKPHREVYSYPFPRGHLILVCISEERRSRTISSYQLKHSLGLRVQTKSQKLIIILWMFFIEYCHMIQRSSNCENGFQAPENEGGFITSSEAASAVI